MTSAASILQTYLDDMGDFVMRERLDEYCARVRLPLSIVTSSANLTIATVEDLQDGFDDFVEMIQSRGITEMCRSVEQAVFDGPDQIIGVYKTDLMDGSRHVMPTFYSKMWLGRYDGTWKATKISNTTNDTRWPLLLTRIQPAAWLPEEL